MGNYEIVEYIENTIPCVINTDIYPTERMHFEIKLDCGDFKKKDAYSTRAILHKFCMGSYDFSEGRKMMRLSAPGDFTLCVDSPDDWQWGSHISCRWIDSKPDTFIKHFPHVVKFGDGYVHDITSQYEGLRIAVPDMEYKLRVKAPFGLFGIMEYRGEHLPLGCVIPDGSVYRIHYFKVYEDDGKDLDDMPLIAHMIPVKDSSGTLCMYDLVRERFFYPMDGSGRRVNLGGENNAKCSGFFSRLFKR